jgi:hypothetical protein
VKSSVGVSIAALAAIAGCGGASPPAPQAAAPPAVTVTTLSGASPYTHCDRGDKSVQRGAEVEPTLAVSPVDPTRLVAAWQQDRRVAGGAVGVAAAASDDGGTTWQPVLLPGGAPCGRRGLTGVSDPWLAIGADGTAYLAALRFAAGPRRRPHRAGVTVQRAVPSLTGLGGAWSAPVAITAARSFDDKPSVTADPSRPGVAFAVWHRAARTLLSRTGDAGASWSRPRTVTALPRTIGQVIYALDGGRLLMVALAVGRRAAYVAAGSDDGGRTWGPRSVVGRPGRPGAAGLGVRAGPFPGVAVLRASTVVAVWSRARRRGSAIVRAVSRDGGRSWSRGDVVLRRPGAVLTPVLAAGPDGSLGLSWTEAGRGAGLRRAEVMFAASRDGGRSWRARALVGPFDLRRAPRAGRARFLGDYAGMAAVPGGFAIAVAVAPPSARRGRADVVLARVRSGP